MLEGVGGGEELVGRVTTAAATNPVAVGYERALIERHGLDAHGRTVDADPR